VSEVTTPGDPMIKTILVPATGSDSDIPVFASALAVARRFDAHLEFLHVRPDAAAMAVSMAADGGGATMVGSLTARLEEEADQREKKASQLFQAFCRREALAVCEAPPAPPGPSARWLRQIGDEPYWVTEYGRAADLLVIGRAGNGAILLDTLESALVDSGRPLLIPPVAPLAAVPETVVIAWKATREAARALTAALPFLQLAKQIVIVTVAEGRAHAEEADRLMAGLCWHGVPVSVRHLQADRHGAADTLLSAAREHAALLVMGGYGHSRLREWIFGGFTLHVLRGCEVPVVMAH
jgi:nucleotide-binding universal stress UspA family protein